jgi:hypothetical protein
MKTLRIALALALLGLCSPAADIAPVVSWSVETNALQPSLRGRKDLEIVRGETVVLECQLLSGGAAINLAEATSVLLRYTPANPATNSTHYVVTGAVHSAATGKVRVRWTPAAAPTADRLQYEIAVGSSTSTVARAWGLLRLLPGVGDDSTGSAVERSTIDWSTVNNQNPGSGPWPSNLYELDDFLAGDYEAGAMLYYGTNGFWTVVAAGSAGQVLTSQGAAAPSWTSTGAGDVTGITGSGGIVVVTNGNGPVPDINVSTNAVRAAIADDYISRFGDVMDGGPLEMGNAAGYSFAIGFRDAVTALHLLRVTAAGVLEFDDLPVLNTGSSINWSSITNTTGVIGATDLASTAVSAASYVFGNGGFTVDADGRMTSATSATGNLITDADKGDVTVGGSGTTMTIDSGAVTAAKLSDAAKTMAFTASAWEGPKVTDTPGWSAKSYAVAGLNAVVAGPVGSATQAAATFASAFQLPSDSVAWRAAKAVSISFIGDSVTSSVVKYRLRIYIAGNNTALFDVSDQVLASTSTITTVDVAGSSLATFTADAVYTIVVDASVTTSGFYFVGQPRIQVLK